MANTLLTNDIIAKSTLAAFDNALTFSKSCNNQYASEFTSGRGAALRIDKPVRYTARTGATLSAQNLTETNATLTVATQKGVDIELTSKELTLDIRDLTKSYIEPAMQRLANAIEVDGINAGLDNAYHSAGAAGTAVNSFTTFNNARAALSRVGVQAQYGSLNVTDSVELQGSLQNSFNKPLNTDISQRAMIGRLAGIDVMESPFAMEHTTGAHGGTPLVNTGSQTGASLVTDGWSTSVTGILKKNDLFTIAGVYSVNPVTQQSTGVLQTFRVTADVDSDGSGNATIPISPAITTSTAYQTVSGSPADDAVITVVSGAASSTFKNNFVYHRDGFCLGWARLKEPEGALYAKTMTSDKSPVSIRMVVDYDITNDKCIYRTDVLYGWLVNPEYVCRLLGA